VGLAHASGVLGAGSTTVGSCAGRQASAAVRALSDTAAVWQVAVAPLVVALLQHLSSTLASEQ